MANLWYAISNSISTKVTANMNHLSLILLKKLELENRRPGPISDWCKKHKIIRLFPPDSHAQSSPPPAGGANFSKAVGDAPPLGWPGGPPPWNARGGPRHTRPPCARHWLSGTSPGEQRGQCSPPRKPIVRGRRLWWLFIPFAKKNCQENVLVICRVAEPHHSSVASALKNVYTLWTMQSTGFRE